MADLEKGLWGANITHSNEAPLRANYIFAMLKGGSNIFALKGGNAQAGQLTTYFEGTRPSGISIVDACFCAADCSFCAADCTISWSTLVRFHLSWCVCGPTSRLTSLLFVATTWFRSIAAGWREL